eukprot:m.485330 g.485330  ORF g.485330 m.485330 type:complete len:84 (-) comp74310_c0_seq1:38-289(-)
MAHENELTTCPMTPLKASVENPGPPMAGADADALARREALVADTVAALRGNSIGKVEIVDCLRRQSIGRCDAPVSIPRGMFHS